MDNQFFNRYQKFAPLSIRLGLAIVFAFFSAQKLADPGQASAEIQLILNMDIADAAAMNFYFGILELLLSAALILGFKIRLAAIISGTMVLLFFLSYLVKFGVSINPNLYRDLGLVGSSIALFLMGAGPISLDGWLKRQVKVAEKQDVKQ